MTTQDGEPVIEVTIRVHPDRMDPVTFHDHLEAEIRAARATLRQALREYFDRHEVKT